jgi:hypothetical protein
MLNEPLCDDLRHVFRRIARVLAAFAPKSECERVGDDFGRGGFELLIQTVPLPAKNPAAGSSAGGERNAANQDFRVSFVL